MQQRELTSFEGKALSRSRDARGCQSVRSWRPEESQAEELEETRGSGMKKATGVAFLSRGSLAHASSSGPPSLPPKTLILKSYWWLLATDLSPLIPFPLASLPVLGCGDDGCIRGWKWAEVHMAAVQASNKGKKLSPILELVNPQKEGPWGALSPIPENNAIAVDKEDGSIFSAAGDSCAYWWDMETGKRKIVFKGHSDYLHSVVIRKSSNQIITGSEDGTARVWDCRSGRCAQVIYPQKCNKLKESSWISSVALDNSESWLVCGTGRGLSAWSLISYECIFSFDSHAPIQDLLFHDNQILAVGSEPVLRCFNINGKILSQIQCAPSSAFSISVHPSGVTAIGGYGGLVDVISEFGSHLCIFCCKNAGSF